MLDWVIVLGSTILLFSIQYFRGVRVYAFLLLFSILQGANAQDSLHDIWNELVATHVSEEGYVNYEGFIQDSAELNTYLDLLGAHHPDDQDWDDYHTLAFWINAYNAFTVQLIIRHYPLESIKDLGGGIYKVNTAWDIKFIEIGNETLDLNNIEHQKIRKEFNEPKIHFALNCASQSCAKLRNEAYLGSNLCSQLEDQAYDSINNEEKNVITPEKVQLSKIFKWYSGDFKKVEKSTISYINLYLEEKVNDDAEIEWLEYEWGLNTEPTN